MTITYHSIGTIRTPYKEREGMPIQPSAEEGAKGTVEVKRKFQEGLRDLDGFSHILLVYHFHLSRGYSLVVTPFLDDKPHGVFCTRAPSRPNGIGISVVKLNRVDGNILHVENVDILDGTPLLDIKPYIPDFDVYEVEKIGWITRHSGMIHRPKSDSRFD